MQQRWRHLPLPEFGAALMTCKLCSWAPGSSATRRRRHAFYPRGLRSCKGIHAPRAPPIEEPPPPETAPLLSRWKGSGRPASFQELERRRTGDGDSGTLGGAPSPLPQRVARLAGLGGCPPSETPPALLQKRRVPLQCLERALGAHPPSLPPPQGTPARDPRGRGGRGR